MFQNFTESWPSAPNNRRPNGSRLRGAPSVAGESVAATESDVTGSVVDGRSTVGQGGVSLSGLSIHDVQKQTSLSQSDRLKRYVESSGRPEPYRGGTDAGSVFGGSAAGIRVPRQNLGNSGDDDDARSVSTAFASQVGGNYD